MGLNALRQAQPVLLDGNQAGAAEGVEERLQALGDEGFRLFDQLAAIGLAEGGCILVSALFFAVGVAANVIYQRRKKSGGITFDIISVRE